jgi:REP element-mobilizing transposase RayT
VTPISRPVRIEFEGAVYHVTARGNERRAIFRDDLDHHAFLAILDEVVDRHHLLCHAYCLMGNHYHLLVETPEANLSRAMHRLNAVYAGRFNRRHERTGHLFQGRFDARLVEKQTYLLAVSRYIALNPVRAGLVDRAENWPCSSFRYTIGRAPAPAFLTIEWTLQQFHPVDRREAARRLREFVASDPPEGAVLDDSAGGRPILGSLSFIARCRDELRAAAQDREIPRRGRFVGRPELKEIFGTIRDREARNLAIRQACVELGYRQTEVASYLGLHYTTIHEVLKKLKSPCRTHRP